MCQEIVNLATIKFNKVVGINGVFKGSDINVQDNIFAMLAQNIKKLKYPKDTDKDPPFKFQKINAPPFINHFKTTSSKLYKIGDTKD